MDKIQTLFDRGDDFLVIDKVRAGCEWVIAGEGIATEKLDGTNVRLTVLDGLVLRFQKRRNPTKAEKAQGIIDGHYVAGNALAPEDKHIFAAMMNTDCSRWPDGEHCCEAIGPNIQGNPLGLGLNVCIAFNLHAPVYKDAPRTFEGLKAWLANLDSALAPGFLAEGIVFHHPDGRMVKIKRKDFSRGK